MENELEKIPQWEDEPIQEMISQRENDLQGDSLGRKLNFRDKNTSCFKILD